MALVEGRTRQQQVQQEANKKQTRRNTTGADERRGKGVTGIVGRKGGNTMVMHGTTMVAEFFRGDLMNAPPEHRTSTSVLL